MIRDVTDLEVYTESLKLLKSLYNFLIRIPKSEYDSVIQCKKCGKSIAANIAEVFAKRSSELEFKRFLKIALGSSDETQHHLRILYNRGWIPKDVYEHLSRGYKNLSVRLVNFINFLKKN